jgi:hypothetical protein
MDTLTLAILLLILALIAHLAEEVKTGFRQQMVTGEMPLPLFVGLNVLIYAFCFTALILAAQGKRLAVPMAWVLAVGNVLNGAGHIGMTVYRRRYFPGALTAFLLLPAAGYLIAQLVSLS